MSAPKDDLTPVQMFLTALAGGAMMALILDSEWRTITILVIIAAAFTAIGTAGQQWRKR